MLTILKHHETRVKENFSGVTDPEEARRIAREDWIPYLKRLRWNDGSGNKVYPNLDEKQLEERLRE
jgi:hypothetical protein